MKLRTAGRIAAMLVILWIAGAWCVTAEEPLRRGGPPKNLLEEKTQWQVQTGDWQLAPSGATAKAGETLAEVSATRGVRLAGRWLSFKLSLEGDNAKAGLWLAGIRDTRGETLRLTVEGATGNLTNGRGKTLAPLGDTQPSVELLLRFEPEKVSVFRAGNAVAELPVTYSEEQATLSLFAERGTAKFLEVLLSGEPTAIERAAPPVAPDLPRRAAAAKAAKAAPPAAERVGFEVGGAPGLPLKSGWNDYFGLHVETIPGPWKMVRQFDGPGFGFPIRDRHTGDVKTLDGPFLRQPVLLSLADFRDWKRKDARGLDENLKALIENDRAAVFIAPWAAPFTPGQQDQVWALMKLVYGANPGAEGRVFFQWGDDINHRRLGVLPNARITGFEPRGGATAPRGSNTPSDASAYAENYFAPGVEAMRRASEEIFHDPQHIPVILGSCSRASLPENRDWYRRVLEHDLAGTAAPSLKGRKVISLVDYLSVNYPFAGVHDAAALQELWADYGDKVRGLWVTEEYGSMSRGAGAFLEKLALYLDWAASNQLTADQTRMFWNLPEKERDTQNIGDFARRLGTIFGAAPLTIAKSATATGSLYRVNSGDSRVLFVNVPTAERRGRRGTALTEFVFDPPANLAARSWEARFILSRERRDDANGVVLPIDRRDGKLIIPVEGTSLDQWGLILTAADAPGPGL
jgi:hypothetical protein